ncbi:aldo/keto reductase [Rhodohalobacter mucosus]|uniref:Oxidoreductase n=1 Tax=Rhodohalobacter mucosus TaxID=2079485 RepID=A0A316TTB0_9BACT|nr:aldo/keto reductase [Rhodohalobacter mucosus]PWN07660.1 oxidoreductase [Rhodohalobacter mucosus]
MKKPIHPDGPELSTLSAGMWRLHEWDLSTDDLIRFIEECVEAGVTTFDHADIYGNYGNEALFGNALRERPDLRDKIEIVTKCGICLPVPGKPEYAIQHYNTGEEHIRMSVENSLRNLNTERIDLLLIHRPDPLMDASEVANTFLKLINEQKVRYVGVSNFTPSQFNLLQSAMDECLVTNQVECSVLHTIALFDGTFDQAQRYNASPMIWSPFAGGRLFTGSGDAPHRVRQVLFKLSEKYSASIDQLALAWLMALPCSPFPVLGTGKIERIRSAADALSLNMEKQDWFRILEASRGHPVA